MVNEGYYEKFEKLPPNNRRRRRRVNEYDPNASRAEKRAMDNYLD